MKINYATAKNIFILIGFIGIIIIIGVLEKEIVEKIFIVSPFIILWLSFIREKEKEKRRTKKDKLKNLKEIQYFFKNFIEWIIGGKERSSYLENFVLRKFAKYERYFGISILKHKELSPDEYEYYKRLGEDAGVFPYLVIYVLEGKYILDYTVEPQGFEMGVSIDFRKPDVYRDDYHERLEEIGKTRKMMIKDIIEHVRTEHNFQLEYEEESK